MKLVCRLCGFDTPPPPPTNPLYKGTEQNRKCRLHRFKVLKKDFPFRSPPPPPPSPPPTHPITTTTSLPPFQIFKEKKAILEPLFWSDIEFRSQVLVSIVFWVSGFQGIPGVGATHSWVLYEVTSVFRGWLMSLYQFICRRLRHRRGVLFTQ